MILLFHAIIVLVILMITLPLLKKKGYIKSTLDKLPKNQMYFNMFLMALSFNAMYNIDKIAIKYVLDFSQLGLFSAYASVVNSIRLIAPAFPFILIPAAAQTKYNIKKSLQKTLFFLIPLASSIVVGSYLFVPILYGAEFSAEFLLPALIAIPSSLLVVYALLIGIFVGECKESKFKRKILTIDFLTSTIFNLVLNIYFIKLFGILGSPIATAIILSFKIMLILFGYNKIKWKK